MSQFTAYQTQMVVYTDTTTGGIPPLERNWSFPGGTPSSATGATASVIYNSPGNYNVTLSVTDDNGLTNSLLRPGVLNVLPGFVTSSFTKTTSSALMSQPITFSSTSTGQPSTPNNFAWKYAGQSASTSVWVFTGFLGDWQNIPGAFINDAPGRQINFNVSLTTSFGPFSATSSQLLPVRKIGAVENFYLNTTDGGTSPYQNFILAEIFNDGSSPYISGDFNYSGDFLIYKLTAPSPDNIVNFHSDQEFCRIICTGFLPTNDGITVVNGYLMVTNDIYGTNEPQIQNGQYIVNSIGDEPTNVIDLYITGDNSITNLFENYNWNLSLLNEIFSYPYPVTHSAQQYSLNYIFPSTELSKNGDNPVVPSKTYLETLGGGPYVIYIEVNYETQGSSISEIVFDFNSGEGNEKTSEGSSTDFYVAQDTSGGDGIVTTINSFLNTDLPGGTGDIVFEAGPQYSVMPGSSPSDYNGLIMKILDPDINSVIITDNSEELSSSTGQFIPPFAIDMQNVTKNNITCTGILNRLELSPYKEDGYSVVNIGGSLF